MTASRKTILCVSHDREFLGNTSTQVVTLEAKGAWTHPAPFATYEEARQARLTGLEEDHRRYQEQRAVLIATLKEYRRRAQSSDVWGPKVRAAQSRLRLFDEKTERGRAAARPPGHHPIGRRSHRLDRHARHGPGLP